MTSTAASETGAARQPARPGLRGSSSSSGGAETGLDLKPGSAFEVAIDERLKALQADVDRIRTRLDWLLTIIVGAALLNILALLK